MGMVRVLPGYSHNDARDPITADPAYEDCGEEASAVVAATPENGV